HEAAGAPPVDVAIGFYEIFQNHFYNSCLYASLGNASPGHASSGGAAPGIRQVHRKVFLPTYGVFDEERFVDRGREIRAFDTRWAGGGRAAILICEDAWHSLSGTIAALQGAQLVIVPSASPARGTGMDEEGIRLPASVVRTGNVSHRCSSRINPISNRWIPLIFLGLKKCSSVVFSGRFPGETVSPPLVPESFPVHPCTP